MATFITSDTHFGHVNIIKYCNRPFKDVVEMDALMIKWWNEVVRPEDDVIHLGDFAFYKRDTIPELVSRLNGNITLVLGNHDVQKKIKLGQEKYFGFTKIVNELLYMTKDGSVYRLRHIPPSHVQIQDSMWMCGHVHEKWKHQYYGNVVNVGVDQWYYTPHNIEIVHAYAKSVREWRPNH